MVGGVLMEDAGVADWYDAWFGEGELPDLDT